MKIKYLKNAPNAKTGDIKDIPDMQANVLIIRGFAREHKTRKPTPKSTENNDSE